MEKAMKELGGRTLSNTEHMHKDWKLVREYPLSPETAGDVAGLAVAGWTGVHHRRQRRARSDRRPVPFRRAQIDSMLHNQIDRMADQGCG